MHAICLEKVSKYFPPGPAFLFFGKVRRTGTHALRNISFDVAPGKVVALAGPNGSGKTTLLKLIATVLVPDSGSINVEGYDAVKLPNKVRSRVSLALTTERSFYPRLTAWENLEFFASLENIPRQQRALRILQALEDVELQASSHVAVMGFSSGMCQRLGIARALLKRPSVLLLDEPTRSLDPGSAEHLRSVMRRLSAGGCTVVLATHNIGETAEVADSLVLMHSGFIVATREITARTTADELLGFYFDVLPSGAVQSTGLEIAR
jgi:ABC-2 type transport system ATP-binding protein